MYKIISFYKYEEVNNPQELRDEIRVVCKKFGLLGRILIAEEGVNGAVSGETDKVEKFKVWLRKELFSNLTFREQSCEKNAYHKLVVRVRDEIVCFEERVNLKNKGFHIIPSNLKEQLDRKEDVVMLDVRNVYEFEVGKFKDAITLPINNFREFSQQVSKI